jgi:ABC-2 type transport system permease protein
MTVTQIARPKAPRHDDAVAEAISPLLKPLGRQPSQLRVNVSLARELAVTSFKLKYAGSALGYVWSLIKPLLIFGMIYAVFALFLLRGQTRGESFAAELLLGIIIFTFFSEATSNSLASIVVNADMIRKAYFPRWILVVAASLSVAMTLGVNLGLFFVAGLLLHWFHLGFQSLLIIPLLLEVYVLAIGMGLLLGALFVYFRDLGHVWEVILQALFFGSAILFPFYLIPTKYQAIVALGPLTQIVEDMRRALVAPSAPWSFDILHSLEVVPIVLAVASLVVGVLVFRNLARHFGERI